MREKIYMKYHFGYATLTKPEVPEFQTGGSGFRHLSGQNRKFRFLKPVVPVSAGLCHGVRATPGMEEEMAGEVKGDAVILTPSSGHAEKGRRMELDV